MRLKGKIVVHDEVIRKRIDSLDILRAIGVILMILGHEGISSIPSKWIHAFHMPMFFIISGFFYKDRSLKKELKRKFRILIVPYFVVGFLHVFRLITRTCG